MPSLTLGVVVLLLTAIGFFCAGILCESANTYRIRRRDEPLILAAKNCAAKLTVELHRGTVEPKSEYEHLIEEANRHRFR